MRPASPYKLAGFFLKWSTHMKTIISTALLSTAILLASASDAYAKNPRARIQTKRGNLTTISNDSASIGQKVFQITNRTKFEDFLGHRVTVSAFSIGDCVKVRYFVSASQNIAKEIELEDTCPTAGSPAPVIRSNPSPTVRVDDNPHSEGESHHRGRR